MKINKKYLIIVGLIFVLYNFLVMFLGGFQNHHAVYWISYAMELASFAVIGMMLYILQRKKENMLKIYFLGYPIIYWSVIYGGIQLLSSIIFMIVDRFIKAAVLIQLLLMTAYVVIASLCIITKEYVEDVQETRRIDTFNMKKMYADLQIISQMCLDEALKARVNHLIEAVRYSDTVSSVETAEIEGALILKISLLRERCTSDVEASKALIEEITQMLTERNVLCGEYKK